MGQPSLPSVQFCLFRIGLHVFVSVDLMTIRYVPRVWPFCDLSRKSVTITRVLPLIFLLSVFETTKYSVQLPRSLAALLTLLLSLLTLPPYQIKSNKCPEGKINTISDSFVFLPVLWDFVPSCSVVLNLNSKVCFYRPWESQSLNLDSYLVCSCLPCFLKTQRVV